MPTKEGISYSQAAKSEKEVKFDEKVETKIVEAKTNDSKRERKNSENHKKDGQHHRERTRTNSRNKSFNGQTTTPAVEQDEEGWSTVNKKQKNRNSSNNNSHSGYFKNNFRKGRNTNSIASNGGEELDAYRGDEFEEAFSDTDDERSDDPSKTKPTIPLPRARVRTLSGTVAPIGFAPKWGGLSLCLNCLQFFNLPDHAGDFETHLLESHQIVISEIQHIVDLKRYVEHYRKRFQKESIDKIFPKIVPEADDPYYGKVDYYYHMTETIDEDYSLRQKLAMKRLEEALECQHRERIDKSFEMNCIFCRYVAVGNRGKLIHHMYRHHRLNLGSPENLVFVKEYIEELKAKIDNNQCIYCEKTYPSRIALMDHMRKKSDHRAVNPKNNSYDKFYIINYLELGKRWLDIVNQDFEDNLPTFVNSDDEEEEVTWKEWHEDSDDAKGVAGDNEIQLACLVCDHSDEAIEPLLKHMTDNHKFDLVKLIEDEQLDTYGRMRVVNYIRNSSYNGKCFICSKECNDLRSLREHLAQEGHLSSPFPPKDIWFTEENLKPTYGNDHLLWILESYFDSKELNQVDSLTDNFNGLSSKQIQKKCIEDSKKNHVTEVIAEEVEDHFNKAFRKKMLVEDMQ